MMMIDGGDNDDDNDGGDNVDDGGDNDDDTDDDDDDIGDTDDDSLDLNVTITIALTTWFTYKVIIYIMYIA